MARKRLQEMTGQVPAGDPRIPYDRTDPMVQGPPVGGPDLGAMPPGAPPGLGGLPPQPPGGAVPGQPDLATLAGPQAMGPAAAMGQGGGTDMMSDVDLAALAQPVNVGTPEEEQARALEAALTDPNTSPVERQQIEQMLAMTARRRMAGLGGLGA